MTRGFRKQLIHFFYSIAFFCFFLLPTDVFAENMVQPRVDLQIPLLGTQTIHPCSNTSGQLECNGLSEYIIILYELAIRMAAIFAVLMFAYAGIRWLSAGGESKHVEEAKKTMRDALIGLVLALSSHVLLWMINPELVNLKSLSLNKIDPIVVDLDSLEEVGVDEIGRKKPPDIFDLGKAYHLAHGFSYLRTTLPGKNDIDTGKVDTRLLEAMKLLDVSESDSRLYMSTLVTNHTTKGLHDLGRGADIHGINEKALIRAAEILWENEKNLRAQKKQLVIEMFLGLDGAPGAILNNGSGGGTMVSIADFKKNNGILYKQHAGAHLHLHVGVAK